MKVFDVDAEMQQQLSDFTFTVCAVTDGRDSRTSHTVQDSVADYDSVISVHLRETWREENKMHEGRSVAKEKSEVFTFHRNGTSPM